MKPSLVNMIASIVQELINTDKDIKEGINNYYNNKINKINTEIDKNKNVKEEKLSYGGIYLEEMEMNNENARNMITKFNLFENNYDTGFHEQEPFYL